MAVDETRSPEIRLLLEGLDQAYDRKGAWHGPTLKSMIRRLDARQAVRRPGPGRHSIAEHVLHAAYWKYTVRRRLTAEKRGAFPLRGTNWFLVADEPDDQVWRDAVRLLDAEHTALRNAVAELSPDRLETVPPGSRSRVSVLIQGIAAHDVYHAGQIQLVKRLLAGSSEPS